MVCQLALWDLSKSLFAVHTLLPVAAACQSSFVTVHLSRGQQTRGCGALLGADFQAADICFPDRVGGPQGQDPGETHFSRIAVISYSTPEGTENHNGQDRRR